VTCQVAAGELTFEALLGTFVRRAGIYFPFFCVTVEIEVAAQLGLHAVPVSIPSHRHERTVAKRDTEPAIVGRRGPTRPTMPLGFVITQSPLPL
jgi:hypothetical protein